MQRIIIFCAALGLAAFGSPVAAQQEPSAPPSSELPPPVAQPSSELPPPFPRYPARAPREHDPNYRAGKRHRTAAPHHRRSAHHPAARRTKSHHRAATNRHRHEVFSKRTTRQCHRMTYRQIMRHKYCRAMIKQDLAAAARHRSARHHKAAHHRRSAHRHGR